MSKVKTIKYNGFIYEYEDKRIPYNPNGGTVGQFICLDELEYNDALVTNVGNCGGCRRIVATNNSDLNLPPLKNIP